MAAVAALDQDRVQGLAVVVEVATVQAAEMSVSTKKFPTAEISRRKSLLPIIRTTNSMLF